MAHPSIHTYSQYDAINPQAWDRLVQESDTATWFQTRAAYAFYTSLPQEMQPFVYAVEEGSHLTGVIVGYLTCARWSIVQHFSRRAIILGGALLDAAISDQALALLLQTLREGLSRQKATYIEFRNFHDYSRWQTIFTDNGFTYQPHLNFQIDTTGLPCALQRMKSNRRRQVRKAFAQGVTIGEAQSEQEVKTFYRMLHDLYRQRICTPLPGEAFFLAFYRQGVGKILLVRYQGAVIGGIVCPILGQNTLYEWFICGKNKPYRKQYPSVMATYAAIEYACHHQIACFDMMGAGEPATPYGVRTFKARFGGREVEYGRFRSLLRPTLYRIGTLAVSCLHKCSRRG